MVAEFPRLPSDQSRRLDPVVVQGTWLPPALKPRESMRRREFLTLPLSPVWTALALLRNVTWPQQSTAPSDPSR